MRWKNSKRTPRRRRTSYSGANTTSPMPAVIFQKIEPRYRRTSCRTGTRPIRRRTTPGRVGVDVSEDEVVEAAHECRVDGFGCSAMAADPFPVVLVVDGSEARGSVSRPSATIPRSVASTTESRCHVRRMSLVAVGEPAEQRLPSRGEGSSMTSTGSIRERSASRFERGRGGEVHGHRQRGRLGLDGGVALVVNTTRPGSGAAARRRSRRTADGVPSEVGHGHHTARPIRLAGQMLVRAEVAEPVATNRRDADPRARPRGAGMNASARSGWEAGSECVAVQLGVALPDAGRTRSRSSPNQMCKAVLLDPPVDATAAGAFAAEAPSR